MQHTSIDTHKQVCYGCQVTSVVSNSVRPRRLQPTQFPRPWDSPGKNTGVGCHFLLQCMKVKVKSLSPVWLFATPWTAAYQAPPSMGYSRQDHWSGSPLPSPMHESEKWKWSRSALPDSLRPHGLQPTRLLCPWDIPGKSTKVGCHCLLWWWRTRGVKIWLVRLGLVQKKDHQKSNTMVGKKD